MKLDFRQPILTDRELIYTVANQSGAMENDAAFASIFLLRHKYQTQICADAGTVYRYYGSGIRKNCFAYPLGTVELSRNIVDLHDTAQSFGIPFRMGLLTKSMCDSLAQSFPNHFQFTPMPEYTEYLYLRENLANLAGSRYHGKRNHIAQFRRAYADSNVIPLTVENADFAIEIAEKWLAGRDNPQDSSLQAELASIREAAENFDTLGLSGLLLYANEKPIGMSVTSLISDDVLDVHFEKVLPEYPHAWSVVANETAKCVSNAKWINREEDLGESGMRTSKTSYHPDFLAEKYFADWV